MARKRKKPKGQPFKHVQPREARIAEKQARKKFVRACNKISKSKDPFSIEGMWTWGYSVSSEAGDQFIAPLVINASKFPVGIAVWRDEVSVDGKVKAEQVISQKLPLPEGQRVVKYQIGPELDVEVFIKSALHMYRHAFTAHSMGKIEGAAEEEFSTAAIFFDPPLMKVDDELLVLMTKKNDVRMLQYLEGIDLQEILAWKP